LTPKPFKEGARTQLMSTETPTVQTDLT
jgi:hypothetical protein